MKTVFVIFIAFVCCWSPYIIVLLYDNSDSLPLSVHLYASMLAHLHASLNFAIYGLMNRNLRAGFATQLLTCCYRRVTSPSAAVASVAAVHGSCSAQQTSWRTAACKRGVEVNRSFVEVEYHQLQKAGGGYGRRDMLGDGRPTFSICMTERECQSTI